MDDKELDLQAEETLAITNPDAYSISNPTPRDWTMSAQEIARSIKINPIEALTTKAQREGPEKWNWLETVGHGITDAIVSGVQDIDEAINVRNMEFSSPDMSQDEAERLMQDALYTRHFLRQTRQADTAEKLKYKKWYDFSNAVGSAIKYAGIGVVTGSPMAIGMIAGIESGAQMEADLVDRYIEKTGDIEGYTKEERVKDLGIAGSYAVFNGITETMLGVERLATGALGRYSTIEALSRLARAQGKLGKSVALKALRRAGMTALEEGTEEFIQSFGEDVANAIAGYGEELGSVEGFKKALTSAIYGAIIGGTMGWGLYRYNRKSIVDKINKWNNERGAGLDEGAIAEVADQIIEDGKTQMLDEIATRIEIKNQYGPAFDAIKSRIKEQLEATGTVPWTDPNKTLDQFAEENARMISIPALYAENVWGIPMSTFIDVAKLTTVPGYPYLMFEPITSIEDAKALIEDQKLIVKEQTDAKKLGIEKEGLKEAAQRRIALLNTLVRNMEREQGITTARSNRKKARADYITAKDLKPESTGKIETAVQAEEGQEYTMFAGQRIPVEYQVVELADIQPSHIDGEPNPNYTNVELQNRASRGTVQDVADLREKATNITPERLLRAPTSAEGAPVVNALGEVIAGNGRAEIIRYAYENPESAEKYRQALTKAGFNAEGMTQPVLVRRNTTMTPEEQVAAAELSNISETSAFDEASQAKRDSQYLKDSESPTDFAGKIPMSERRGLMQNNGKWNNRQIKQRYEDALLSWLTGNDTQLFESLVLDGNISQKVLDTLVANGSLIHTVATQYPDTNLREDIYHALLKMQLASKDNFIELTQQIDISGRDVMPENILIWNWLFADATTNRQFLSNYATILRQNHESMDNGQDMFGDKVAPLSRKDALMQALKKTDEARAQMAADRGREYESLFAEETGEVKNAELAAAIASYQNQFAPEAQMEQTILNKQQFDLADQNARLDEIYPEYTGETIGVDGVERTVYNSDGNRIAKSAEALRNFWRWFGDSKVVDEQGRPLVVYHGSDAKFEEFDLEKFGQTDSGTKGKGFYFTQRQKVAKHYGKNVISAYLKIENPFYLSNKTIRNVVFDFYKYMDLPTPYDMPTEESAYQKIYNYSEEFTQYLKTKGFDGVIDIRAAEKYTKEEGFENVDRFGEIMVFDPNQIKSTDNSGLFDPNNANINDTITKEKLLVYLDENWEAQKSKAEIFIKALQHPENLKRSRGQQLAIEVPNADEVLNEDMVLADQASAPKIRAILEDFLGGGLLLDFVRRANKNDFKIFRELHNRPEEDLRELHETAFEEAQETMFGDNPQIPESGKLLIDYLMDNMKGDDVYLALIETIPETYIELKSGEVIGEEKDYDSLPEQTKSVMGMDDVPPELARDASLFLNDQGIKGIQYRGGTDRTGYVTFSDEAIKVLKRLDDELPTYYKRTNRLQGQYDKDLQTILMTKYWDETTFVHEMHHRYLDIIWGLIKKAEAGTFQANAAFLEDTKKLMAMLDIDPKQDELTVVQQEKFATMVEAYVTGLGVDDQENLAFQGFLHWVPEKYRSIMDLGYLDAQGKVQNPILDQASIDFFNRWFASPLVPSLPSAPDAQRMVNPTDDKDEIIPSSQKVMNDREKEWGQDSEIQNKADAQLWKAIGENNPSDLRAAIDGQEEINKEELKNTEDDRILPEKPTLREKWFKARQPDARAIAAEKAREYVAKNPEHARELAFADPETLAEFDAPVDQGMLIRAVMETVGKGSDEWYILDNNLAMVKSMSGSTLALSGDMSHQAYLDAKREVEAARELKAAINYAGTRFGALDKWNMDIRAFAAKRTAAIMATAPNSKEREVAIKAFLEEAKTKFSGNTTNAVLNKLDLTGYQTKNSQAFIKWAEKQIKNVAHAQLDTKEQAELMKASVKAQLALRDIDSRELKDGQYVRAVAAAKDIRHWQFVKDKMKKAYIGRWGKFGIWFDNLVSSYVPSAMLMSFNTLFFANVPSTAINNTIVKRAARLIGDNKVDDRVTAGEVQRIKQIFNASGMNLAQMEKPTSPSLMHGEKYTNQEQKHWYNFTFDVLSKEDNWFRIPTFVDALARIATRDAKGDKNKATILFKQYAQLNDQTDEAKIARKEALAVANMAVFTQDGMMASALNHIRSNLNTLTRTPLGLDPNGFGLGNLLAPFLKTGANVIEMGITATLAPIRTAVKGLKVARGKTLTDMEKIALRTDWAYFCLAAVATALMAAISGPDDDWYEEPYEPGKRYDPNKPYDSIRIGNTWIKLDIFGPLEVPLRTAAMLVKNWEDKKLAAVGNGLYEAIGEVPLVNQFVDSNTDYMTKYPDRWASSFAYNQLNKFVPAQVKTLTRAGSRAAGTTVDMGWAGKTIQKKFHRNYGLDGAQLTTNDLINILTNRLKYTPK